MRVERGHEHERILEMLLDAWEVRFDARGAVFGEGPAGVAEECRGLQERVDDDRLKDVEFELAARACDRDGGVVPHHLCANHSHGFHLRGVDLAGHDGGAGFVFGNGDFADAAARAGGEEPDVVRGFHETHGELF